MKDPLTGNIVLGTRMFLRPNIVPNHTKNIQWADMLPLLEGDVLLCGPFDLLPISLGNQSKNLVAPSYLSHLGDACEQLSIIPPRRNFAQGQT